MSQGIAQRFGNPTTDAPQSEIAATGAQQAMPDGYVATDGETAAQRAVSGQTEAPSTETATTAPEVQAQWDGMDVDTRKAVILRAQPDMPPRGVEVAAKIELEYLRGTKLHDQIT